MLGKKQLEREISGIEALSKSGASEARIAASIVGLLKRLRWLDKEIYQELPAGAVGRADIVFQVGDTSFLIEVKKGDFSTNAQI